MTPRWTNTVKVDHFVCTVKVDSCVCTSVNLCEHWRDRRRQFEDEHQDGHHLPHPQQWAEDADPWTRHLEEQAWTGGGGSGACAQVEKMWLRNIFKF